ncbi:type VII secretion system-associated protein [Saccharopolyspora sp. NFXS83]|uniref:type VII secretion system-associated protein n=1 Tax=Saccharopolyspora sp. NFXS83 TaxID=2993560 RepID=UPI00224B1FBE|nr:type VII secretion system-associated protein [Saccharopolyspora sp. NFXS83]MCX2731510.1 type VII secretion system-associated protein [Saccharopolyspora sp. NFXS83]
MRDDTPPEPADGEDRQWVLLLDPAWRPESEDETAPVEAVIGAWLLEPDGGVGPFQPNPAYQPSREDSPTDPVDATVQLVARGDQPESAVVSTMRDAMFGIALDERGAAIVTPSPDGVPAVLVATAPLHARRLEGPTWQEISAADLAASLPEEGVDVLLNPGAPASMRVVAAALRAAVAETPRQAPPPAPFARPDQS